VLATEPTLFRRHFIDGTTEDVAARANTNFKVSNSFSPVLLREGVGVNTRLVRERFTSVNWRVGFGMRQNLYSSTFVENDDPNTVPLDYFEIDTFSQTGLETTITASARLMSRLVFLTTFDLFGDFEDFSSPVIDWRNSLRLRLAGNLSLDYTLDVLRQPQVIDETQVSHSLLLRYSFFR
jgi:hypothetical protein